MIGLIVGGWWYWHPLSTGHGTTCSRIDHTGCGYSLWSGLIGDLGLITIGVSLGIFIAAWWRKHNCHVHRCWRLQWHPHPDHGHPVCAVHHPDGHHGTWWRTFHRQPRPRDHFLAASKHAYDHGSKEAAAEVLHRPK